MNLGLSVSASSPGWVPVLVIIAIVAVVAVMFFKNRNGGATNEATQQAAVPFAPVPPPAFAVQPGIDDETVAAISAAVCAFMDSTAPGTLYAIRGIKRTAGERPVWGFAGMQQNTRPF